MNLSRRQIHWRRRIFALCWLSYAAFYFGRKNLSVVWTSMEKDLDLTATHYATIIFVYSLIYAIGQFLNGFLSGSFGPRKIVSIGLFLASIVNFTLGIWFASGVLIFLAGLNGYAQSTGWSGLIKNMTPWFVRTERGIVMSWWATCYVVGAFLATIFATYVAFDMNFLSQIGWKRGFIFPSLIIFVVACLYALFTRNNPKEINLSPIVADKYNLTSEGLQAQKELIGILIRKTALWVYASCYFILKLTRYAFLFWLPIYLEKGLHHSKNFSGYASSAYELIGFFGVIIAGYASDKFFKSDRFGIASIMLFLLAISCLLHPYLATFGKYITISSIALIGICTYGADAIISTAGAMDVGGKKGAAITSGIINGIGSIGQMLSGFIVVYINQQFGWNNLFYFFVILTTLGGILSTLKWGYSETE